ncbi:peroxisomal hydratase-dehydrogenase-epimerase-like [Lucilia cuprina]|uniref:peroxisomal hydratase-dehydrogenase-epimerase-like n=1 Tax=Lucilia cuprina TaxID=7375 RepID=UPI001F058413|nr:peroxisomal hydratase-dehydrogenase-epimerase-like [Lucilia cuprina]
MELENKNIIYLGGFGGIGQKCIVEFLKRNIKNLIIFDLNENSEVLKQLQITYKSSNIQFIQVDVTKSESIENAYKQANEILDNIDVVVNGCGLMNDRHLDLTIDINLRGVIQSSLNALNYMDKSKGGRGGVIVNISSIAGIETTGMFAIYSAAKHGVTAFSRSMANPLYFHHTQVNFITICPGLTETALLDAVQEKATLREYAGPMVQRFANIKRQSAEACAQNLVKAVEINKLGSVWLLDLGEMSEVEMPILWKPTVNSNYKIINNKMDLKGKNIIYIGGFGGIGQKCLEAFLKKQVKHLVICDLQLNADVFKTLESRYIDSCLTYIPIDITKRQSIEETFKLAATKLVDSSIDVVVNGCGLMDDRYIDLTIDINLTGVIHSTLIALDYMDQSKGGRGGLIVNISSVAGLEPSGMFAVYSAAKCGLTAFTRALANPLYFAHTGVSLVTMCPGFTDTALLESIRGKETLTKYAGPMAQRFAFVKKQSAEICAENLVDILSKAKNGSVWMLDLGKIKEMEFAVLWKPAMNE